jgi:hypothetical protein
MQTNANVSATASVAKRYVLDITPDAAAELDQLMRQTGDDDATTFFRKALALYKLALDAAREGKEVGIAATPDSLETRFVGLMRNRPDAVEDQGR